MNSAYMQRRSQALKLLGEYRALESAPESQLDKVAQAKLLGLLKFTKSSSWWRSHLGELDLDNLARLKTQEILSELPILSREKLQRNSQWMRMWIPGSESNHYKELKTSGSTGQPVRVKQFLPIYRAHYAAHELMDAQWSKRDLSKNLGYFRIDVSRISEGNMGEPLLYLEATGSVIPKNMLEHSPRELLEIISEREIGVVSVNAMVQRLLAIEQIANPIANIKLEQFVNWADYVSPELRQLVDEAFGAKIVDRYSATEFGYLALQCPEADHLHATQVNNFIEILDDQNNPVRKGESGRVVVTALNNQSQPMIRYELGDYASWGEHCTAGISFPILEPKIVRERDMHLDKEGKIRVPYPDALSLLASGAVSRYQLFQFTDRIAFLAEFSIQPSEGELNKLKSEISKQFSLGIPVSIVELTRELIDRVHPWKNRRVLKFDQACPENLTADSLVAVLPRID